MFILTMFEVCESNQYKQVKCIHKHFAKLLKIGATISLRGPQVNGKQTHSPYNPLTPLVGGESYHVHYTNGPGKWDTEYNLTYRIG